MRSGKAASLVACFGETCLAQALSIFVYFRLQDPFARILPADESEPRKTDHNRQKSAAACDVLGLRRLPR